MVHAYFKIHTIPQINYINCLYLWKCKPFFWQKRCLNSKESIDESDSKEKDLVICFSLNRATILFRNCRWNSKLVGVLQYIEWFLVPFDLINDNYISSIYISSNHIRKRWGGEDAHRYRLLAWDVNCSTNMI